MYKLVRRLLLAAVLLLPMATQAQVASLASFRTGVDTTRWIQLDSATATTVTFTGTGGNNIDNAVSGLINIGFPFYFGQDTATQFTLSTNGRMRLGSTPVSSNSDPLFYNMGTTADYNTLAAYSQDNEILNTASSCVRY